MKKYNPTQENRIDLERDIAQLDGIGLAEEPSLCDTCNQPLTEGRRLTVYARRSADTATFELGMVTCAEHHHHQRSQFDTAARELIIEGCVGRCSDHSSQASWPILLHPQARVISPLGSTEGYMLSAAPWFRSKIASSRPKDLYREMNWSVSPTANLESIDTDTPNVEGDHRGE